MTADKKKSLAQFPIPFAKQVELFDLALDNNINFLRVRIREGQRFTVLDLEPFSAKLWGETMVKWAKDYSVDVSEK